jgi:hypothetical protein
MCAGCGSRGRLALIIAAPHIGKSGRSSISQAKRTEPSMRTLDRDAAWIASLNKMCFQVCMTVAWVIMALSVSLTYGANLTVTAISGIGKQISNFQAIVSNSNLCQRAQTRNGKVVFENLPPGTYRIQIRSDIFVRRERTVEVGVENSWHPIVLAPDAPIDPIPMGNLRGHVNALNIDNLWLKLVSVFDDTCLHAKMDAAGNFYFRGIPTGAYLLLVYSDTKLLHQSEINVGYFDRNVLTITP